jgi:hypothetical protein
MKVTAYSAAALVFALAHGVYGQYSPDEAAIISSCRANLAEKIYSPAAAEDCLKRLNEGEPALMDKMREAGEEDLPALLRDQNALADLKYFLSPAEHENVLREGLRSRLEKGKVLPPMGLASLVRLYEWVDKHLPGKSSQVRTATFAWDSLGPLAKTSLPSEGTSQSSWDAQSISRRELLLGRWARKHCDTILKMPRSGMDLKSIRPAISEIREHLGNDYDRKLKLEELENEFGIQASAPKKTGQLETKGKKLDAAGAALSSGSSEDRKKVLDRDFDNNTAAGADPGVAPNQSKSKSIHKLDPDQFQITAEDSRGIVEKLKPALFGPKGEFSDTSVGRSVSEYYTKTRKIDLALGDAGTDKGHFDSSAGRITISEKAATTWLMDNGVTADELQRDPAKMAAFARYFAPLVVHEGGGHERDQAWINGNKLQNVYHEGNEKRAFSLQALFVMQKSAAEKEKGNPYYLTQIGADDVKVSDILREKGIDGITQFITPYYFSKAPSLAGRASEQFARCEQVKKELALRALRASQDSTREGLADAQRPDTSKTASLQAEYLRLYNWYKLSYAKEAADANEVVNGVAELSSPLRKL